MRVHSRSFSTSVNKFFQGRLATSKLGSYFCKFKGVVCGVNTPRMIVCAATYVGSKSAFVPCARALRENGNKDYLVSVGYVLQKNFPVGPRLAALAIVFAPESCQKNAHAKYKHGPPIYALRWVFSSLIAPTLHKSFGLAHLFLMV